MDPDDLSICDIGRDSHAKLRSRKVKLLGVSAPWRVIVVFKWKLAFDWRRFNLRL